MSAAHPPQDWPSIAAQAFETACLDVVAHEDDADPLGPFYAAQKLLLARVLLARAALRAVMEAGRQ